MATNGVTDMKPGYLTSEHAVTWAVIVLAAVAMFRGRGELDALAAVLAPAVASAAYSASRGRVKGAVAPPLDPAADADAARSVRQLLGELFRGRIVRSPPTAPGNGSAGRPVS
jgi:hypothetical protein